MADDETVTKEIFIEATPEEIFPYLTQSEKYVLWMGLAAELDARPGGIFKVDPNTRDVIFGEYVEVIPPTRVVFTWGWKVTDHEHPIPAGSTRVEIDLIRRDDGTLLRLTHRGLPEPTRERHRMGWSHYLGRLGIVIGGRDAGPDPFANPAVRHG